MWVARVRVMEERLVEEPLREGRPTVSTLRWIGAIFGLAYSCCAVSRPALADVLIMNDGTVISGTLLQRADSAGVLLGREFIAIATREASGVTSQKAVKAAEVRYVLLQDSTTTRTYDADAIAGVGRQSFPATIAVGANLDFLDGVSVGNPYYAMRVMLPTVFGPRRALFEGASHGVVMRAIGRTMSWMVPSGFSLSMEQARFVARDTSISEGYVLEAPDTVYRRFSDTTTTASRRDVTGLGLAFYWPIITNSRPGSDVRVWATILGEFREPRLIEQRVSVGVDSVGHSATYHASRRYGVMSLGFTAVAERPEFTMRLTVTWALWSNGAGPYVIQGELRERKYGVMVSGEVRGLSLPEGSYIGGGESYPEYQASISKSFALDKLVDFVIKS